MLRDRNGVQDERASMPEPILSAAHLRDADAVTLGDAAAENQFRALLDALPAAIYVTDAAGRITYYNQAAVDLAGRRPELGTDEWCVSWRLYSLDGSPLPHDQCPMAVALKENRAVRGAEAILERPDGARIPFMPYPTPLRDASGKLIGAVNMLVAISERKDADEARAYLAAIIESTDDAIVSKTLEGVVTSWNKGAEAMFGYTAEEMVGQPITRLFPPDRLEEENLILNRIKRGERIEHFETVRRRKDGRDIDISVTISPVRDGSGRIVGVSKIARDITDQKRAEATLRDLNENLEQRVADRTRELAEANNRLLTETAERERTEAELLQARKMEAVGQLVSGLAHDFNNLLAAVLGNLELLEMRLPDDNLLKLVQAAARSARHGAKLNEQLLAFSRKQHLTPKPVDLNELVVGTQDLLRRSLGGTVEVTTALAGDLWPAFVDPHQLELVILNLAINARDAMPAGGQVLVETRNVKASERNKPVELVPGDYVLISVTDNGTGMSPDVLARACEPFFTTKEPGKGSGLGLAQVYGLAQQSGGGLRITSTLGKGTSIAVYLPRSLAEPLKSSEGPPAAGHEGLTRRARVLVVDDNEDVRDVIVAYLDVLGYRALQAASGQDALELLEGGVGTVDLLIADYAMPGMSGTELARAVSVKRPELPVIVITGYADTTGFDDRFDEATLLRKPFRINELGTAIERAVQHSAAPAKPAKVVSLRPRAAS
jgi:PAS domain S-box-containing protein